MRYTLNQFQRKAIAIFVRKYGFKVGARMFELLAEIGSLGKAMLTAKKEANEKTDV